MAIELGQDLSPPSRGLPRTRVWQGVALAIVLAAVVMSVWGTPRQASEAAFGAALRGGDVRAAVRDDGQNLGDEKSIGAALSMTNRTSSSIPSVVWTTGDGRIYRTSLATLAGLPSPSGTSEVHDPSSAWPGFDASGNVVPDVKVDVPRSIEATARADGVPVPAQTSLGWSGHLGDPLAVLEVAALFLLVMGPQPRRFTKWGQFWLLGIPAGAGLIWWVLRDAPFDAAMRAVPEPAPHARGVIGGDVVRRSGAQGFGWALVGSIVLSAVVLGVVQARGWGDRPEPDQGSVTFQVVYDDGQRATLNF
jgi:hypothetical protein